jgi:hypothetical protein
MEKVPFARVVVENPFEACTIAPERGTPESQALIVPLSVPCAGAVQVGNLNLPILVRQLKLLLVL